MVWWRTLSDNCFYVNKIKIDFSFDKSFKRTHGVIILDTHLKVLTFTGRKWALWLNDDHNLMMTNIQTHVNKTKVYMLFNPIQSFPPNFSATYYGMTFEASWYGIHTVCWNCNSRDNSEAPGIA